MRLVFLSALIALTTSCSSGGKSPVGGSDTGNAGSSCGVDCGPDEVCVAPRNALGEPITRPRCFQACRDVGDCDPGEDCGNVDYESPPVCAPRVDPVWASDFDQSCSSDDDCTLVRDGEPCVYCSQCVTADAPINRDAAEAFYERMGSAQQQCVHIAICSGLSAGTKARAFSCDEPPSYGVRCTSGTCRAYARGSECGPNLTCEQTHGTDGEGLRCVDGFCVACVDDSECPGSGRCVDGQCPPTCETASDCEAGGPYRWLCDGSCVHCGSDSDCGVDAICRAPRGLDTRFCIERDDIHAQCADGSCPWNGCQEDRGYIECRNDFTPGRDFDQSCADDSECVAVAIELWSGLRNEPGPCGCECFWQTVNTATEAEYRSVATDGYEPPQCTEPPVCDCGTRAAVCSNGRCRIE